MCADNSAGRQSAGPGRHRRTAAPVVLTLPPAARATSYVGRVGALAVALGVGTAILGTAAVAAADTDTGPAAESAAQESTDSGNAGNAVDKSQARRSGRTRDAAAAPEAAASTAAAGTADSRAATPARRPAGLRPTGVQPRDPGIPTASLPQSPARVPQLTSPVIDVGAPPVPTALADLVAADNAAVAESPPGPQVAATAAAAPAPVMTAFNPLAALFGGGGGVPLFDPFSWAALAFARREEVAGATPEVVPAATVTTAAPAASSAADAAPVAAVVPKSFSFTPTSGFVGTTVAITSTESLADIKIVKFCSGANFCDVLAFPTKVVKVDVSPDDYDADTNTISVDVPPGAATGKIRITTVATESGAGTGTTSSGNFTVNASTIKVASIDPTKGSPGSTVTITGTNLQGTNTVRFCGSASNCGKNGVAANAGSIIVNDTGTQLTVTVPNGAENGPIQVVSPLSGVATSSQKITVVPIPQELSVSNGGPGKQVTITGGDFTDTKAVAFCQNNACSGKGFPVKQPLPVPASFDVVSPTQITVTVPDNAATGTIKVTTPNGTITSPTFTVNVQPLPAPIPCDVDTCRALNEVKPLVVNSLATTIAKLLPSAGPSYRCTNNGCPIPDGAKTTSVADTIGMYAFNIINALTVKSSDTQNAIVGDAVAALFQQSNVLSFISQTVAARVSPPGSPIPGGVANTVGNAVATLVQNSLGNAVVATQLAPFLYTLGIPTDLIELGVLKTSLDKNDGSPIPYLAPKFQKNLDAGTPQKTSIAFFSNAEVQKNLGTATASAVEVLLGQQAASWTDPPPASSTAIGNYLGLIAATSVLKPDNPYAPALAATIGNAINGLFGNIADPVAGSASNAVVALLRWAPPSSVPDQQSTAVTLSYFLINTVYGFLNPAATAQYQPQPPLQQSLAAPAGAAVTVFVESLLGPENADAVKSGLGQFVNQVIPGVLSNIGVQDLINQTVTLQVSEAITKQFGNAALGAAVGPLVGQAAVQLVSAPVVGTALAAAVNAGGAALLNSEGVVSALAVAAGALTTATMLGKPTQDIIDDLRKDTDVQGGVGAAASAAVTTLLTDTALLPVVDAQLASLISGLLTDTAVQAEVSKLVATTVSNLFNGGELGQELGAQAAAAVVALMTDPAVSAALPGLLDTFFRDFFGAPGVVNAFANTASQLALSVLAGVPVNTALTNAVKSLQQNTAVLDGLGTVVGDAVVALLDTPELWAAVDAQLTTLVIDVLADATVQDKVAASVAAEVIKVLGDGVLGTTVGAQVGAAVVALMKNTVVSDALAGVVDTLFVDFFGTPGVVSAFGTAAGDLAVAALVGDLPEARPFIIAQLRENPAVDAGVQLAVGGAVTTLLTDTVLWSTVDAQLSALVLEILGDSVVQQAAGDEVAKVVAQQLGGGELGQTVGAQVGETVASLVGNPVVGAALVEVVDTLTVDFFRAPGVVSAFADAAGDVALAAVVGDNVGDAVKAAQAALRANTAVQSGASLAVGDAVTVLLTDTALLPVLDAAAASLITEVLNDSPVQDAVDALVTAQVSALLQGGTLGATVGAQVGAAVVDLMTTEAVEQILPALFDTLISDFFSGPGVVSTFADTASQLTLAVITGVPPKTAFADAEKALRASTAIEDSAGAAVGAGLTQVLADTALWATVDLEVSSVIDEVLTDSVVQQAVNERVTAVVAQQLGGELGQVVGAQVGAAVVALMGNSVVEGALNDLVDSVFSDFFGTFGVVTVLANAAGELTAAAVKGDLDMERPYIIAQLRDNPNIDAGVQLAVGDAVTTLLENTALWSVVDAQVSSLIREVLGDSVVLQAVDKRVTTDVSQQIGGPLGAIVGAQAGAAVAGLLGDPVIADALVALVDTVAQDFFGFPGVVTAFADAASEVALAVVIGDDVQAAQKAAVAALRSNLAVDGGAETAVGAAVNQLLTDAAVLSAVQTTLTSLVTGLLGDPAFEDALDQRIATDVANQLDGELGQTVGPQVGAAVTTLLASPEAIAAAAALINTVFSDFLGDPGVVSALTNVASDLAVLLVTGEDNVAAAVAAAVATLRVNPGVDAAVGTTATAATAQLLGDTALIGLVSETLGNLAAELVDDVVVEQAVATAVGTLVAGSLSGSPIAPIAGQVGQALGAAVYQLLATPGAGPVAGAVIGSLLPVFLGQSGVTGVLAEAAGMLAVAAVKGDPPEVSQQILAAVLGSPPIQSAINVTVTGVVDGLLSDTAAVGALGAAVATFVTDLVANPDVDQFAGAAVASLVTGSLDPSPIAAPLGQALGAAVYQLLATPGVATGLGTVFGSALPDFVDQAGVPAILAGLAGRLAAVLASGVESPSTAVQQALAELRDDPVIQAALRTTLADALSLVDTTLLRDLVIQQSLGAIVTTLITDLATDQAVQTFIEAEVGPTLGPVVAGLLADPTVVDGTASLLGAAVTEFLAYPGFSTALTDSLDVLANAVLDGTPVGDAVQTALGSLRSSPAFSAAANAIVPTTVNNILGYPQVRQAVGVAAQREAIAALQRAGISNRFLDGVAGQIAQGTAEALLDKNAGIELIDAIAVRIVEGMPLKEVTPFATEEVVRSLPLQLALGFSIGQGIGSLFGDNIIGDLVGLVAAFPATLAVGVTASIVGIYQWLFGAPSVGANRTAFAAQALSEDSHYFQPLPGAADLYVMDALVAAQPEGDQPRTVDVTMAVGAEGAPLLVGFRFRVGRLFVTPESVTYASAGAPRIELVS